MIRLCCIFFLFPFLVGAQALPKLIPYRDGKKWGYADSTGKILITPKYDKVSLFVRGCATVYNGERAAYIDSTGKELTPFIYGFLQINKEGEGEWFSFPSAEGLIRVRRFGKWGKGQYGFIDRTGKEVIPAIYESAYDFCEGRAAVLKDGKIGFIDAGGNERIVRRYDGETAWSLAFSEGKVWVEEGRNWVQIDTSGRVLFRQPDSLVRADARGGLLLGRGGKVGVWREGKWIIPPMYDALGRPDEKGWRYAVDRGQSSFIDSTGKVLFALAESGLQNWISSYFHENRATFYQKPKFGMIDRQGNIVVPAKYSQLDLDHAGDNVILAADGLKWGVIDTSGNVVLPFEFARLHVAGPYFSAAREEIRKPAGPGAWNIFYKYELLDRAGNKILPFSCDWIRREQEGLYQLSPGQNEDPVYFDRNGRLYWSK